MSALAEFFPNGLHNVKTMYLCLAYPCPDTAILNKPADHLVSLVLSVIALKNKTVYIPRVPFCWPFVEPPSSPIEEFIRPVGLFRVQNITHLILEDVQFQDPDGASTSDTNVLYILEILKGCPGLQE